MVPWLGSPDGDAGVTTRSRFIRNVIHGGSQAETDWATLVSLSGHYGRDKIALRITTLRTFFDS